MAERFCLDNGLTVLFEEVRTAQVAALQIWVKAGSADEREDEAGIAHLHEHMLFKGTSTRGPGEIARAVESRGGEINAWTSFDQTVYHVVIASAFWREGLAVLSDAVRDSLFDPDELSREIEVVCEEIKRGMDAPARRASRQLFSTAYRVHPYRHPVIGWEESVRSFTRDKVLGFYRRHYTPANVVVSIAGDLGLDEARAEVEARLGGAWGRPFDGAVHRPVEPTPDRWRIQLTEEELLEAQLDLAFPIPSVSHEDVAGLDLLSMVAGQGHASRLLRTVKRERGLVNGIHAYAYTPKDAGLWAVSSTLSGKNLTEALEATCRIIAELKAHPVDEDELRRVKAFVESDAVYQRETVQGQARRAGFFEAVAGSLEAEERYLEQIGRLDASSLLEIANRWLKWERCVVSALLPNGTMADPATVEAILESASARPPPRRKAEAPRASTSPAPEAPLRVTGARAARGGISEIIEETLPSGARILVREEPALPLFSMRAAFLGGLRSETKETNGLALLLGRMLTRGTASRDEEAISRAIDGYSGSLSGNAGRNSIGSRGEFLSRHLRPAFELFADCLVSPSFPEAPFARERALQLQDIATRGDRPTAVAFELFARTLFGGHPYGWSVLGEPETVAALTPDSLRDYHQRWCDPSGLVLAVVGDVRAAEVIDLAREAFGRSSGRADAPPPPESDLPSEPREAHHALKKAQAHLVLGFPGARMTDPWRHSLEVLSTVLSGQGGRLFLELRDKRSLAYSVSSMSMEGIEPGYFAVYMGTSPEKVPEALEGIRAELTRIREADISDEELARAKRHLIGTRAIGLQRNGARAATLALDVLYGLGKAQWLQFEEQISAVTREDVRRTAERVIDFSRAVVATVGPG